MTLQEALTILTTHQQWRQGADIEMAEPKVITEALDVVLAYHHVGVNEMVQDKEKIKTAKDNSKIGIRWKEYQDWLNVTEACWAIGTEHLDNLQADKKQ